MAMITKIAKKALEATKKGAQKAADAVPSAQEQAEGVVSFFAGLTERKDPNGSIFNRKFSKSGKTVGFGIAAWGFGSSMVAERNLRDMGSSDGRIYNATPSMAQYQQAPDISAGASGDLVFALNNCRSTGFLG